MTPGLTHLLKSRLVVKATKRLSMVLGLDSPKFAFKGCDTCNYVGNRMKKFARKVFGDSGEVVDEK